jgi:predicted dehydrogenase
MNQGTQNTASRRDFLKNTGRIAAASALAGIVIPHVHAAENNTIQVALIGCGGRGTGAAADAMSVQNGPIKLVALADAFQDRLSTSYDALKKRFPDQVDVPDDRKFVGLDAYRKAIDCLKPDDVAVFCTPPAFRWVHFDYAIQKGVNTFMEKPVTVDGPTTRKMLSLADESVKKNLKVGVGLMVRHCRARRALFDRIRDGQIGDLITLRTYRMHGPIVGHYPSKASDPKTKKMSEMEFQIRKFHAFLWASGGTFSDFYIHFIDECSWMKDAWPINAQATGGRQYRGDCIDQNFDNYSVEYTFADGVKLFLYGRSINGCYGKMASYAHGSKGTAIISTSGHAPGRCRIYKGQKYDKKNLVWGFPQPEPSPTQMEWVDLIEAIRQNKPYNEAKRGAEASLVTSMGRMAAHTGQLITYDQILNLDHEFAPGLDKLTMDSPAPLLPDAGGKYPVPQPGIVTTREF